MEIGGKNFWRQSAHVAHIILIHAHVASDILMFSFHQCCASCLWVENFLNPSYEICVIVRVSYSSLLHLKANCACMNATGVTMGYYGHIIHWISKVVWKWCYIYYLNLQKLNCFRVASEHFSFSTSDQTCRHLNDSLGPARSGVAQHELRCAVRANVADTQRVTLCGWLDWSMVPWNLLSQY